MHVDTVEKTAAVGADGLMTLAEVAQFLRCGESSVAVLIAEGILPVATVGKRMRRVPRRAVIGYANQLFEGSK